VLDQLGSDLPGPQAKAKTMLPWVLAVDAAKHRRF
jgi:hypothetical protein